MMSDTQTILEYHDLIAGIVAVMETRDTYTASHSLRVADMTQALCGFLSLSEDVCAAIHIAAHLHDIGKIGISDAILRKEGPLDENEWSEIRQHPVIGAEVLSKIPRFAGIADLVRHHHERWDGGGYPDGLAGTAIPLGARIIAVADSIDAMLSSRSYRPGMGETRCRAEIERNIGRMYDPGIAAWALGHWDALLNCRSGQARVTVPQNAAAFRSREQLAQIQMIHTYLTEHLDEKITLEQLCRDHHVSLSWLKAAFKEVYGLPLSTYLRHRRIESACRLLRERDRSIAEIAQAVGYESQSRFAAAFKACTGQTPSAYRKAEMSKPDNFKTVLDRFCENQSI